MHVGETPVNGGAENSGAPTSGTELAKDAAYGGWPGTKQEDMIVEKLSNRSPRARLDLPVGGWHVTASHDARRLDPSLDPVDR